MRLHNSKKRESKERQKADGRRMDSFNLDGGSQKVLLKIQTALVPSAESDNK
jgi:hypothetical protein